MCGITCAIQIGCTTSREFAIQSAASLVSLSGRPVVEVEPVPSVKRGALARFFDNAPEALSERTGQLLRRYDLERLYEEDPDLVVRELEQSLPRAAVMEDLTAMLISLLAKVLVVAWKRSRLDYSLK